MCILSILPSHLFFFYLAFSRFNFPACFLLSFFNSPTPLYRSSNLLPFLFRSILSRVRHPHHQHCKFAALVSFIRLILSLRHSPLICLLSKIAPFPHLFVAGASLCFCLQLRSFDSDQCLDRFIVESLHYTPPAQPMLTVATLAADASFFSCISLW